MIRFLPSMTFCVCWHESIPTFRVQQPLTYGAASNIPSTGLQSHAAAILPTVSVTVQFLLPTLTRRMAASAAVYAALSTSAFLPVTGSLADAPTTRVSALTAAKPSIWAPTCSLTTSPLARVCDDSGSEASGEKCATQLFTETEVGNARPGSASAGSVQFSDGVQCVKMKIAQISACTRRYRGARTLGDLDALDGFVVHSASALLDELVALEADVEDLGALDRELDELLHRGTDDVRRGLSRRSPRAERAVEQNFSATTHRHEMPWLITLYLVKSASAVERGVSLTSLTSLISSALVSSAIVLWCGVNE